MWIGIEAICSTVLDLTGIDSVVERLVVLT